MEATWKSHVTLGNQKLENREGCTFRKTIKTVNRCRRKLLLLPQKPNSLSRLEEKKYTEKNQTLLSLSLYIYISVKAHAKAEIYWFRESSLGCHRRGLLPEVCHSQRLR